MDPAESIPASEILVSLTNIINSLTDKQNKLEQKLADIEAAKVSPDDVGTIVQAYTEPIQTEFEHIHGQIAVLKTKAAARPTMDPAFMAELKSIAMNAAPEHKDAVRTAVPDHLEDVTKEYIRDQIEVMLRAADHSRLPHSLEVGSYVVGPSAPELPILGTTDCKGCCKKDKLLESQHHRMQGDKDRHCKNVEHYHKSLPIIAAKHREALTKAAEEKAIADAEQVVQNQITQLESRKDYSEADKLHRHVQIAEANLQLARMKMTREPSVDRRDITINHHLALLAEARQKREDYQAKMPQIQPQPEPAPERSQEPEPEPQPEQQDEHCDCEHEDA